jgi:hypothetical protein
MFDREPIGASGVLDRFDVGQLCQSRAHISRSAPFADQAADFDDSRLAVIAHDPRLWIHPNIFQ